VERQGYLRSLLTLNSGRNRRVLSSDAPGPEGACHGPPARKQEPFGEMFEHDRWPCGETWSAFG